MDPEYFASSLGSFHHIILPPPPVQPHGFHPPTTDPSAYSLSLAHAPIPTAVTHYPQYRVTPVCTTGQNIFARPSTAAMPFEAFHADSAASTPRSEGSLYSPNDVGPASGLFASQTIQTPFPVVGCAPVPPVSTTTTTPAPATYSSGPKQTAPFPPKAETPTTTTTTMFSSATKRVRTDSVASVDDDDGRARPHKTPFLGTVAALPESFVRQARASLETMEAQLIPFGPVAGEVLDLTRRLSRALEKHAQPQPPPFTVGFSSAQQQVNWTNLGSSKGSLLAHPYGPGPPPPPLPVDNAPTPAELTLAFPIGPPSPVPSDTEPDSSVPSPEPFSSSVDAIGPETRALLDPVLVPLLKDLCSDLELTTPSGAKIHQHLMDKKEKRLTASGAWRSFRLRINAFIEAFSQRMLDDGISEAQFPLKTVRSYLHAHPLMRRTNPAGKRAKSKGNALWLIDARLTDQGWELRPFKSAFQEDQLRATAKPGAQWQHALPRVDDPHNVSAQSKWTVACGPLPRWLAWHNREGVVSGVVPANQRSFEIPLVAQQGTERIVATVKVEVETR